MNLFHTHALRKCVAHVPDALRTGLAQLFLQHLTVLGFFVHAVHADFQSAQGFLKRLLEGAPHGHDLTDRLHLSRQTAVGRWKLFEGETRNLGHHIIDAGLETRRRGTTSDVVTQLVERVADCQLRSDFGNRKTSCFGGQRRGTRHARIHLDHHHASVHRIDRKLDVGAPRIDPNFTQHGQ